MRLSGIATSNAIEAGLGALWSEDPRYPAAQQESFARRVRHVVAMTFLASNGHGGVMPAYARYTAFSGNNFLSNTWREPSEANVGHAVYRAGLAFVSRMASNTYEEFWPDFKKKFFRR